MNLFIASDIDWKYISEKINKYINIERLEYNIKSGPSNVKFNDRTKFIKDICSPDFEKTLDYIKILFGKDKKSPMGGTSFMTNMPFSIEKNDKIINYPGDNYVLESTSSYLGLFLGDIQNIQTNLNKGLTNLTNNFWYRDVMKWLQVICKIYEPDSASTSSSPKTVILTSKFYILENLLRKFYLKQIRLIFE